MLKKDSQKFWKFNLGFLFFIFYYSLMIILSTPSSEFEAQNRGATTSFVFIFRNGAFIFMQKR